MRRQLPIAAAICMLSIAGIGRVALPVDCNQDGVEDDVEVGLPSVELRHAGFVDFDRPMDKVVPGDIDGDGDLDLVVPTFAGEPQVQILVNDGRGGFSAAAAAGLSSSPRSIALEDLDGDGALDVAVAIDFGVELRWNDGKGLLVESFLIPVGSNPSVIRAGDIDGDGDADLITANFVRNNLAEDTFSLIENRGGRELVLVRNFASHRGKPLLETGDLDGDGDLDLLIGTLDRPALRVFKNDGAGGFSAAERPDVDLKMLPLALALADLDGDVDLDAAVIGASSPLALLRNAGDGRFRLEEVPSSLPNHQAPLLVEDLDGNGDVDIIVSSATCWKARFFLNEGGGHFSGLPAVRSGFAARALAAGDWDGDGVLDLIASDPGASGPQALTVSLQDPSRVLRDCNRNGIPDDCDADCNGNLAPDDCDVAKGISQDCDANGIPDECDPDCDWSGAPDACEIRAGQASDCDESGVPDSCELTRGDCDRSGLLDSCEIEGDAGLDCDGNGVMDSCDLQPRFALEQEEYGIGGRPESLATADLDADGDLDIAVGGSDPGFLSLLANRGDGTYAPAGRVLLGQSISGLTSGDLDADGDTDIAAGGWSPCSGGLWAVGNEGGWTFRLRGSYDLGFPVKSLHAVDFDGNGVLDLAAGTAGVPPAVPGAIWVLRGRGDGAFAKPELAGDRGANLAVADFDGDRDLDVAGDKGSVLLNRGDGTFLPGSNLPITGWKLEAADLDGDGDADLVIDNSGSDLQFLRNSGKGVFQSAGFIAILVWASFLASDLNGDARPDLAGYSDDNAVAIALHTGEDVNFYPLTRYPAGLGASDLAPGDVDGDGDADIVAANPFSGTVSVLRNKGDGTFVARAHYLDFASVAFLAPGDFDEDGDQDMVGVGCCPVPRELMMVENDGKGAFRITPELPLERDPSGLAVADWNGDGALDVAFSEYGGGSEISTLSVVLNNQDGTFRFHGRFEAGSYSSNLVAADVDGDRDQDMVVYSAGSGEALVYSNRGDASFTLAASVPVGMGLNHLRASDLDGDHDQDLIAVFTFEVSVWMNGGLDGFGRNNVRGLLSEVLAVALGDLDGDGREDLMLGLGPDPFICEAGPSDCVPLIFVAWNDGRGAIGNRRQSYPVGIWPLHLAVSDMDGDGDIDLLAGGAMQNEQIGQVGAQVIVLANLGDGRLVLDGPFSVEEGMDRLFATDVEGDRRPDIVSGGFGISVLLNRTRPPPGVDRDRNGVPDACEGTPLHRGDTDGDGRLDITDPIRLLEHLFLGGASPGCREAADAQNDGRVNIADPVFLLAYLFLGGPPPAPPGPGPAPCGLDPDPPASEGDLGCERYAGC